MESQSIAKRGSTEPNTGPTFAELASDLLRNAEDDGFAPNTVRGYRTALRHHLLPRFGDRPIDAIGSAELGELIVDLRTKGLTENGIIDAIKPLRKVLELAVDRRIIDADPYDALPHDVRPRPQRTEHRLLSPEQIEALAATADEPTGIAIGLSLFCGLRNSEARAARVREFNLDELVLDVTGETDSRAPGGGVAKATGSARVRTVDALDDAFGFLRALRAYVRGLELEPDDFIVRSPTGKRYDRGNFSRRFSIVVLRAGLEDENAPPLTFEQLRNNFAAIGARIGADPITLLRQLGKAHTASLQSYIPYFQEPPLTDAERQQLASAAARLCAH